MKHTCQLLLIFVLLFTPICGLAAQGRTAVTTTSSAQVAADAQNRDIAVSDLFSPVPLAILRANSLAEHQQTAVAPSYTTSALPLLTCIAIGMALGGIVSVRLGQRLR